MKISTTKIKSSIGSLPNKMDQVENRVSWTEDKLEELESIR
jgi:flagellin-like hook-associated protein FlgL